MELPPDTPEEITNKRKKALQSLYDIEPEALEENRPEALPLFSKLRSSVDRYKGYEVIARGAMKTIAKVFDNKTGRYVAIANLHANAPKEMYEPFLREARLTATLDHPNIIKIFDIDLNENGCPFFTMDLKTGENLEQLIQNLHSKYPNRLPESEQNKVLNLFIKLCDAIAYAHSKQVIHLDLKPANIQVGHYGEVLVCDWGLGKVLGQTEDYADFDQILFNPDLLNNMTLNGAIKGTPGYMAPEQVTKGGHKTIQSDIFALGAILHHLLTNKVIPQSEVEAIAQNKQTTIKSFKAITTSKPSPHTSLLAIAQKALAAKPEDRYPTVKNMRDDVEKYLHGYSTSAEDSNIVNELRLFYRRNRALCKLSGFFLTVLALCTISFVYNLNRSRILANEQKQLAQKNQEAAEQSQKKAEHNLQLLLAEQDKGEMLKREHASDISRNVFVSSKRSYNESPKQVINEAIQAATKTLEINPNSTGVLAHKARLHFMRQEFTEAINDFESISTNTFSALETLSHQYEKLPKNNLGLLETNDFGNLLHDLLKMEHPFDIHLFVEQMMTYDTSVRERLTGHPNVVEKILQSYNNDSPESFNFTYIETLQRVIIEGKGLKNLTNNSYIGSKKCLLRELPIRQLFLRNTNITNLDSLKDLPFLTTLDIRESPITEIQRLHELPALKKLIISKNQVDPLRLKKLPPSIKIIEAAPNAEIKTPFMLRHMLSRDYLSRSEQNRPKNQIEPPLNEWYLEPIDPAKNHYSIIDKNTAATLHISTDGTLALTAKAITPLQNNAIWAFEKTRDGLFRIKNYQTKEWIIIHQSPEENKLTLSAKIKDKWNAKWWLMEN